MALSPDIMKTYGRIDIAFTHGKGSFLFSEDGSKYLDYALHQVNLAQLN